jgi:regulator of sigma E protease
MSTLLDWAIFLLVLGFLVLIHELGHFATARRFGIGVKEFAIGLPPRLFGRKRGETLYALNAIPIGGYVRLVGEDEAELKSPDSFQVKPPWQRFVVLFAGSATHFILAFVIFFGLALALGRSVATDEILVDEVVAGGPAAEAGLEAGDEIQTAAGESIDDTQQFLDVINDRLGEAVTVEVRRADAATTTTLTVVPRANPPAGQGPLGVLIAPRVTQESVSVVEAVQAGIETEVFVVQATFSAVGELVGSLFTRGQVPETVSGPVGIQQAVGEARQSTGLVGVVFLTGLLAANLAVFNLLPFPALDGGRIVPVVFEWITGKRIPPDKESLAHTVGFVLLLLLIVLVTAQDLRRLFS